MKHLTIEREPHFLPPFSIKYDGKYISLYGRNKNHPLTTYGLPAGKKDEIVDYDKTVLIPIVKEIRNVKPTILNWGTNSIIISFLKFDSNEKIEFSNLELNFILSALESDLETYAEKNGRFKSYPQKGGSLIIQRMIKRINTHLEKLNNTVGGKSFNP